MVLSRLAILWVTPLVSTRNLKSVFPLTPHEAVRLTPTTQLQYNRPKSS